MTFSFQNLIQEAFFSLRNPREGAQRVLRWQIPPEAIWPIVVLTSVLSALAAELDSALNPPPPGAPAIYVAPLVLAGMLAAVNVVMALALGVVGRFLGGRGAFRPALMLMAWQQFMWLIVFLGISVIGLVLPPLFGMLSLAAFVFMIWVMVNFTAELHGFVALGRAALVMVLASIVTSIVLLIALQFVGLTIVGGTAV